MVSYPGLEPLSRPGGVRLGYRGMELEGQLNLRTRTPIVEGIMTLSFDGVYWSTRIRHRHEIGRFTDCDAAEYAGLTTGELCDVFEATVAFWGLPPEPW